VTVGLVGLVCMAGGNFMGPCDQALPPQIGDSGVTGKYVGSERCAQCHARVHEMWSETLHGNALATLEAIGQGTNSECLPCHTVGYGEEGGFVDRATTNALANVGCEDCHGPGRDHVMNVADESLRPPKDISAELCGRCHTGEHQPNFDQWQMSAHAQVTEHVAEDFTMGESLNRCGTCHSGDFRYLAFIEGETVEDDLLMGVARGDQNAIVCVICHKPHERTFNAPFAEEGRDYQLRFPEVMDPVPTNTIEAATNFERFNLCGQCHRSRGETWRTTSRPPHHSIQSNVYIGEMPMPEDEDPLVLSRSTTHRLIREQCATCHMYRKDFESEEAPAISGHLFTPNFEGCVDSGCHPSAANAQSLAANLKNLVTARLAAIKSRLDVGLGGAAGWEYSSNGGPDTAGQAAITDNVKKVRFLYYYTMNDGSFGTHNPAYVDALLDEAEDLLDDEGI
jgi:hypothetical protein